MRGGKSRDWLGLDSQTPLILANFWLKRIFSPFDYFRHYYILKGPLLHTSTNTSLSLASDALT